MKAKLLLLSTAVLGFVVARANNGDPEPASPCKGKKDEINGTVLHADNRKPLKDVSISAYSSVTAKKEKIVQTDDAGNYYFDELKPGTYKFVFEKSGYKRIVKEKVVIKTDEAFQMNIEMIENKGLDVMPSPLHFSDF